MDYQVRWSDVAIEDLRSICAFIAGENPEAAIRIGRGIIEHVRLLETFPQIGPWYPRGSRGTLREIVFRTYRIFYDVCEAEKAVEVLHVWHSARQEPNFD